MTENYIKTSSIFPGNLYTQPFRVVLRDNPLCPGKEVVTNVEFLTMEGNHDSYHWPHYFNVMNPDGFVTALRDYKARYKRYRLIDSPDETKGEAEARTTAEDYNFLRALAGAN